MAKKKAKHTSHKKATPTKKPSVKTNEKSFIQTIPILPLIALIAITFGLFSNTFNHGFTVDDPLLITRNKQVAKGISAIGKIWSSSYLEGFNGEVDASYRPFSISQFALGKSMHNLKPSTMHVFHVIYFAISIGFCFLFTWLLTKKNTWLAFGIVLLYACHPIHTEVLNNLKSRDEIMMALGIFAAGFFYLQHLDTQKMRFLLYTGLAFFVSLFSKETALPMLLTIPVIHLYYTKSSKNLWRNTGILGGIALLYLLIRFSIVGGYDVDLTEMSNALVGRGNLIERFPDVAFLMGKYLMMLFVPYPLSVDYSFNSIPLNGWTLQSVVSIVIHIGLIAAMVWGLRKKNILGVGLSWYFASILLASNLLALIGSTFAERFLFLPSFGFCLLLGIGIHQLIKNNSKVTAGVLGAIAIAGAILTFQRNTVWKSDYTLFMNDVSHQESNARVQTFAGKFTMDEAKGKTEKEVEKLYNDAEKHLLKGQEIAPEFMLPFYYYGLLKKKQKDYESASIAFEKAVELESDFKDAKLQYGLSLAYLKKHKEAIPLFQELYDSGKTDFNVTYNLGHSLYRTRQFKEAENYLVSALDMKPNNEILLSILIKLYRDGLKNEVKAKKYNEVLKGLKK